MTRFAFVFCTLGFVYINLFIVISDITILHDMVRRSPEPLGRRMVGRLLSRETKWAGTIQNSSADMSASHEPCLFRLTKIFTGHKDRHL